MLTSLMRNRSLSEVADTDEYNRQQFRRMARTRRDLSGVLPVDRSSRQLRVLIVDDHRATADTLTKLVRIWGHDVKRAYDGVAGFALAAAYLPDVMLLDIVMPLMSGAELAIQVAQHARLKNCLMIAITGSTDEGRRRFCEMVGISAVLIKPVSPTDLQALLARESVRRQQMRRQVRRQTSTCFPATTTVKQLTGARSNRRARFSDEAFQGTSAS